MRLHGQDVYDAYVEAGWWSQETLLDVLDRQVRERGDELAVADPPNRDELVGGQPKRWAWRDLDARVDSIASALLAAGIQRDDVVGVQLPNIVELPATLLAIMRVGAIASPFPVQFRAHEIVQLADIGGMVAMVTAARIGERADAEELVAIRDRTPSVHTVLALGAEEHDQVVALDVEGAPDRATLQQRVGEWSRHANDAVTLCWTSGTESAPKGVPRTSADWMAIARATTDAPPLDASDVLLNPFPMVNMAGIGGMMVPWLMTGAQLIMHHPFDLPTFLKQIAVERPTYTVAPPAVLNLLLAKEELLEQADVSSLKVIGSGSAPLSTWMVEGWKDRYGIEVTNFFGSNEGIALIGDPATVPDPANRAQYFPWFGAEGLSWPNGVSQGTRTRLVDVITGREITEPGYPGELRIAGPTVFAGYWRAEEQGLQAFDDQGYLRTGDVFEIVPDDAGELTLLRFVDRAKDLIVRGGYNISPAEVEGLVLSHPKVAEVAAIGLPDQELGERTCVVVVPAGDEPPTLAELVDHLREQQVASYKLPERLEIVEQLPRNPVGKILKRDLRDQVAEEATTA